MCNRNECVKVIFENGEEINVKEGTRVMELISDDRKEILGININNENRSLYHRIISDSICSYVTYNKKEGKRIYGRTLKFIFLASVYILFKDVKVFFTNKNGSDYFAEIENLEINSETVCLIKNVMQKIIEGDFCIKKIQGRKDEVKKYYSSMKSIEQVNNLERLEIRKKYTINMFDDNFVEVFGVNYYNYLYGNLALSTGYIKGFELKKYNDGIILMLPKKDNVNEVDKKIITNCIFELSDEFSQICMKTNIYNATDLNVKTIEYRMSETIRLTEYDSDVRISKMAEKVVESGNIKFIFISGGSASGKTTTAQKLADFLKLLGKNSKVISMDNFFQDYENIPVKSGRKDYECFENIDIYLFKDKINRLLNGESVILPTYNFKKNMKEYITDAFSMDGNTIFIIEGIHALNPKVYEFIPKCNIFKLYVAPIVTLGFDSYTKLSTSDLRLIRRMIRDFEKRGLDCEWTLEHWNEVISAEEENIFPYVALADYIFNTNLIYEWCILKAKAEALLLKVKNTSLNYAEARRLYQILQNFVGVSENDVPITSILREFIGGGCYNC